MKAHPELEHESRDWTRVHKPTGHRSTCTPSTVLHRLYVAQPDLCPLKALELIEAGGPVDTGLATYHKGK
ncbi:MAG: hypothetical protein AB7P97_20460 [Hyphomonadaceae bacterium]